jgi:protein-disulfide isomerase
VLDGATVTLVGIAVVLGAIAGIRHLTSGKADTEDRDSPAEVALDSLVRWQDSVRRELRKDRLSLADQSALAAGPNRLGRSDPAVTIVVFFDYGCGYCKLFDDALRHLLTRFPDHVGVVYRSFLPKMSQAAAMVHAAASCAADQGRFWAFDSVLFAHQRLSSYRSGWRTAADSSGIPDRRLFDACIESGRYLKAVESDTRLGVDLGVTGTPTSFVNGRRVVGSRDSLALDSLVAVELDRLPKVRR